MITKDQFNVEQIASTCYEALRHWHKTQKHSDRPSWDEAKPKAKEQWLDKVNSYIDMHSKNVTPTHTGKVDDHIFAGIVAGFVEAHR